MRRGSVVIIFTFIALCPVLSRASVTPANPSHGFQTHLIQGLGKGSVALDRGWEFHTGDNLSWSSPGFDDSQWQQVTADETWGAQGFPSYVGFAWYRYHLSITPVAGGPKEFALLIPGIDDAYELYWNGVLVGSNGKLPPNPTWYTSQPSQTFGIGNIESGVLAVRVWKAPLASNDPSSLGGFEGLPLLGGPAAIAAHKADIDYRWLRSNQLYFGLNSLYALVALLSILAWFRDRSQWLLLCMAGYTLTQVAGMVLGGLLIPMPFSLTVGLLQPVLMVQDISLWYLLLLLLSLEENVRLVRIMRVWVIVFCVAFCLDGLITAAWGSGSARYLQIADALLTVIFTPLETLPIVLVIAAVLQRKRLDSARWIVAICAFVAEMIFVVRNATAQFVRFTHWTVSNKINAPMFTLNGNPVNSRSLANAFLLIAIVYAVYRYMIENRRQQSALEQEFKNARELQQVLVPEALPSLPGFAMTSAYRPAQEVGGDFFQIIPLDGGSTLIVLGDVSGKGLKAAMAVSLIVGAARMVADFTKSPAEILAGLNRRLYGRLQGGFATCIALQLDPDGSCAIASAGHPAPFLNQHELNLPGALPLGIQPSVNYEETFIRFGVGDHFALYTDGLLEARNRDGEIYSFARLQTLFATNPNASQATEAAVNFGQDDDITVLTLTRLATSEESNTRLAVHPVAPVRP
jgi:hypothetical protein